MRVLRDRETSAKWDSIRPPSGHKKDYEEERLNRTVSS